MADERIRASREKLRVLDGLSIEGIPSDRIALSLAHSTERIDVAISAIRWIEPRRYKVYGLGKKSWISSAHSSKYASFLTFVNESTG